MGIQRRDKAVFNVIGYTFIALLALACFLPFLMVVSGSLSSEASIVVDGYSVLPRDFSLEAYGFIFRFPEQIIRSYINTIFLTATGTFLSLFICSMTAYALQRPYFKMRNVFALYFFFTTLFTGGLVPWYILMIKYLGLKNSYLALLLPILLNVFDLIIMRSFMRSVPEALAESAKIDGAGEFYIYWKIFVPISKPAIVSVGLFIALRYWNDWYNALFFITDKKLFPLQYYLYNILNGMESAKNAASKSGMVMQSYPAESFKLAMTVVATGPIAILYPMLQKNFIKGLTVGAVKG